MLREHPADSEKSSYHVPMSWRCPASLFSPTDKYKRHVVGMKDRKDRQDVRIFAPYEAFEGSIHVRRRVSNMSALVLKTGFMYHSH